VIALRCPNIIRTIWDRDWMKLWFYVKTSSSVHTLEDRSAVTVFTYMSEMKEMKPLLKVDPPATLSDKRKACDKAFALACRYFGGQDLV